MAVMSFSYDIIERESLNEKYDSFSTLDHVLQLYAMGMNSVPLMHVSLSLFLHPPKSTTSSIIKTWATAYAKTSPVTILWA